MTAPRRSDRNQKRAQHQPRQEHLGLTPDEIHQFVVSSRGDQGLGSSITDPVVLNRVVALTAFPEPTAWTMLTVIGMAAAAGRATAMAALSVVVAQG